MSTVNDIQINETIKKDSLSTINASKGSIDHKNDDKSQITENKNTKSNKPFRIILIIVGVAIIVALAILIPIIINKKNKKKEENGVNGVNGENGENGENEQNGENVVNGENGENGVNRQNEEIVDPINANEINEKNYIKTTMNKDFIIPSNGKLQVVGSDFQHKNSTLIIGKNKTSFIIEDNGTNEGVSKEDFPLYYIFNETITNGSYLFKDVKCFKTIDLSKMDSSKMIDASNMFENSNFEEIYFGTENKSNSEYNTKRIISERKENLDENSDNRVNKRYLDVESDSEKEKRKEYFDTTKIKNASQIFMNCENLKKIQFPPFFNVGKNAKGMFKGCSMLEEVNTTLISSSEIVEMESMFEDCESLREISFSNDFLTGEVKSLYKVFKNTHLTTLDIIYFRLFNLEDFSNIFERATIRGTLKIGKDYSNNNIRDNFFREIAKVTYSNTKVFTPKGTIINQIFQNIYFSDNKANISVMDIDIDYAIRYTEDENYRIYSNYLHVGLGWDYDASNTYDLDSSILTFDSDIKYLTNVNYQQLNAYGGIISLNGDDLTGRGDGDDEEIRILLDSLPSEVQIFTVQLNSFSRNILKYVKSAYIRLSTDTEVIGTYSITQAGENIGLLIGCFSKTTSNTWYFKPLNKVIPGHVVTESITSIQEILHSIFDNK